MAGGVFKHSSAASNSIEAVVRNRNAPSSCNQIDHYQSMTHDPHWRDQICFVSLLISLGHVSASRRLTFSDLSKRTTSKHRQHQLSVLLPSTSLVVDIVCFGHQKGEDIYLQEKPNGTTSLSTKSTSSNHPDRRSCSAPSWNQDPQVELRLLKAALLLATVILFWVFVLRDWVMFQIRQ